MDQNQEEPEPIQNVNEGSHDVPNNDNENDDEDVDTDIEVEEEIIIRSDNDEDEDEEDEEILPIPDRQISTSRRIALAIAQQFRQPLRITRHRSDDGRAFSFFRGRHSNATRENDDNTDDNDIIPANAIKFDTDLPGEHSYLGSMVRVSGVDYLESGKYYRLLIFMHHSMVFPGETLPMIIPDYMFDTTLFPEEGLLFGIVFPNLWKSTKPDLYGVTCQIYEKGNDQSRNVILKSRAHQRFVISKKRNTNFSEFLKPHQRKIYANVRILPEIILPDPLTSFDMGSLNRFRNIDSMTNKLRSIQAATTIWPKYVYDRYDLTKIIERAKKCLYSYKIESMPTDHGLLSFWLGRNLLFDTKERVKLFLTDSVNIRMQIIEKSLDNKRYFCCRRCNNKIANCSSLFAMSKHGVQSNYCNPSGFIHETNTVYGVKKDAVYPSGPPSTEFSWFPGYSWQIILCRLCDIHLGWKFVSTKSNFVPKKFYGLSGTNIIVDLPNQSGTSSSSSTAGGNNSDQQLRDSINDDYIMVYEENVVD